MKCQCKVISNMQHRKRSMKTILKRVLHINQSNLNHNIRRMVYSGQLAVSQVCVLQRSAGYYFT